MSQSHERIVKILEEIKRRAQLTPLIVAIFGGGSRLQRRRAIAKTLTEQGFVALVPEDDFPPGSPSTYESVYLRTIDLAFIFPESSGSITEFGQVLDDQHLAPKLIVLIPHRYHPVYGKKGGYLTDAYMKHLARHGHVYAFDDSGKSPFPKSSQIILKICETTRDLKAQERTHRFIGLPSLAKEGSPLVASIDQVGFKLPRVRFVLTNSGNLPTKIKVRLTVHLGQRDLGVAGDVQGYYSGGVVWNLNALTRVFGNFAVPLECVDSAETLRIEVGLALVDRENREYPLLPNCYTYDRRVREWFLEPTSFENLKK